MLIAEKHVLKNVEIHILYSMHSLSFLFFVVVVVEIIKLLYLSLLTHVGTERLNN
jgi:hypothetical protein